MQAPVGGPAVCRYGILRRLQVDFNVYLIGGRGEWRRRVVWRL